MSAATLLPLPVILPIGGAVLSPIVAKIDRRLPLVVGLLALPATLALLLVEASDVFAGPTGARTATQFFSNERPVHGHALGIAFTADPFGLTFAVLTAAVGTLLLLSALSELGDLGQRELGGLACLAQLLLAALIAAALTADIVNLFVWFEVAALSSYGLTGFFLERPIALEAAFKNLVLTSTAGFAVFIGAAILYATSGALNLGQLHVAVPVDPSRAQLLAIGLLVAGFATKAGLVPFHAWLPDAHTPVPGAVSALFSALMVDLGIVALARFGLQVFPDVHGLLDLLTAIGVTSALLGALLALRQDDLKRLLAWDTVSQTGVLITGFASRTPEGVGGGVLHLVSHGLFKALLFLCAGAVVHATGCTRLSDMGGLLRRRPLVTVAFLLGCLAIAGVPPLNGYASLGLVHEGLHDQPVVFGLLLVAQVLTIAALGRAAYLGFLRRRPQPYDHLEPPRIGARISLITLSAACLASGVLAPQLVRRVVRPATASLLSPSAYARATLSSYTTLPRSALDFDYAKLSTVLTSAGELAAGLLLLVVVLRHPRWSRLTDGLAAMHTGSVNDYAAFLVSGLVAAPAVLLLAH